MPLLIDDRQFDSLHDAFLKKMKEESGGIPFQSFDHRHFMVREVAYKWRAHVDATTALKVEKWQTWRKTPGKIIVSVKAACSPSVCQNLLYHKYGMEKSSESPLYLVETDDDKRELEKRLIGLAENVDKLDAFGEAFDALANHVRENSLGCKWPFFAYLGLLFCPDKCFPILPTQFDALLKFYGINESVSYNVTWERFGVLLDLADVLKQKLVLYGTANTVEIQSYIYVVSEMVSTAELPPAPQTDVDFIKALEAGQRAAQERERIGLLGEKFIYEQEQTTLRAGGRSDLADKVRLVSEDGSDETGYDLLSFDLNGNEKHIEIKTTVRSHDQDYGFWLTTNEVERAKDDAKWRLVRIWEIDSNPQHKDLGNVVTSPPEYWVLNPSAWSCRPVC